MFIKKIGFVTLLAIFLLVACSKKKTGDVLVETENQTYKKDVFVNLYKTTKDFHTTKTFSLQQIKDYIDKNIVDGLLLTAEAYDQHFDQDSTLLQHLDDKKKQLLIRINGPLYKLKIGDGYDFTDDEIKELYDKSDQQIKVALIVVSAKKMADSLYQALQNGADFAKLAREFSIDMRSKNNGGEINQFLTPGIMNEEFDQAAFSLQLNQISKPVKSAYGYQIIKLLSRQTIKKQPLEQARTILERKLTGRKIGAFLESYVQEMYDRFGVTVHAENCRQVINLYHKSGGDPKNPQLSSELAAAQDAGLPIVTYDQQKWTLKDFVEKYNGASLMNRIPLRTIDDVKNFVRLEILQDLMYLDALRLGLDKGEEYQQELQTTKEVTMMQDFRQQIISDSLAKKISDEDFKNYYEANKEKFKGKYFDDVKSLVEQQVRNSKAKEIYDNHIAELRKKYPVKFHDDVILQVVDELNLDKKGS